MRHCAFLLSAVLCLSFAVHAQRRGPCSNPRIHCFALDVETPPAFGPAEPVSLPRLVKMNVRASHGGIMAHHWLELETSRGMVTIGYGPASLPFIDAGQISVWNENGEQERRGLRLLPTNFNYAKPPGKGEVVGQPVELTIAQSDALVQKESHRKAIVPYIPFFHDCRTFVCTVKATAAGKSTLPCYLLFKGYW